jgi:hypothetical protein
LTGKVGLSRAMMAPPDVPTIPLPAAELADYAGRFADPGVVSTFTVRDDELTLLSETVAVPNTMEPAVGPPPPHEPLTLGFLAKDSGMTGGTLIPFVRNDAGRVGWVSGGLRLVARAKPD